MAGMKARQVDQASGFLGGADLLCIWILGARRGNNKRFKNASGRGHQGWHTRSKFISSNTPILWILEQKRSTSTFL
jgi:hypothetical protein